MQEISLKSVLSVVVLYHCKLEESKSVISLNTALKKSKIRLTLLVHDNGPESQYTANSFAYGNFDILYQHDPKNLGIGKAYNKGIQIATGQGADWILLLDQDSEFSSDFMDSYLIAIQEYSKTGIACIIPQVLSANNNAPLSPSIIYPGGISRPLKRIVPGIIRQGVTSINSGTFISTPFIKSVGGFNPIYPLDMLDHWYFREIRKGKKDILLLNTCIHHSLSVNTFFDDVSLERYENILASERKFFRNSVLDICLYKFRLAFRIMKQYRSGKIEYARLTREYLTK